MNAQSPPLGIVAVVEPRALWREGLIALIRSRISSLPVTGGGDWGILLENTGASCVAITSADWVAKSRENEIFLKLDFRRSLSVVCIGDLPTPQIPGAWKWQRLPEHADLDTLLDAVCAEWRQNSPQAQFAKLTGREREVVRRLCEGQTFKDVAEGLGVGISTVQCYKKRAMDKLGVTNFADLCRYTYGWGLGI